MQQKREVKCNTAGRSPRRAAAGKTATEKPRSNCCYAAGKAVVSIPGKSSQKPLKNPIAGKIRISIAKIF